jgi:hypothetical protein
MSIIVSLGPPRKEYFIPEEFEQDVGRLQRWLNPKCLADVPLIRDTPEPGAPAYQFNMVFYDRTIDLVVGLEGGLERRRIYCRECDGSTGTARFCGVSVQKMAMRDLSI